MGFAESLVKQSTFTFVDWIPYISGNAAYSTATIEDRAVTGDIKPAMRPTNKKER